MARMRRSTFAALALLGLGLLAAAWTFPLASGNGRWQAYLEQTSAGAFSLQQVLASGAGVGKSATGLAAPAAGLEYAVVSLTLDSDRPVRIDLFNDAGGGDSAWLDGHTFPGGVGTWTPNLTDGLAVGGGKTLYVTSGTFVGTISLYGRTQSSTTGTPYPLGR